MDKDTLSTLAGAAWGWHQLSTVNWQAVPGGEGTKAAVALVIIGMGYLCYRNKQKQN